LVQASLQSLPYDNEASQQIILHGLLGVTVGVGVGDGVAPAGVFVGVGVGVGVPTEVVGVGVGQNVLSSHLEAFAFNTLSTLLMFAHKTLLSLVIVPIF
jgi:hypothetical protein